MFKRQHVAVAGYAGSKNHLAAAYLDYLVYDNVIYYVEPFGGMFGVGLNKAPHPRNIYNDVNPNLSNLMTVFSSKDTACTLFERMLGVDYSEEFFEEALHNESSCKDAVQKAVYTWYLLVNSYNGQMKQFRGFANGGEEIKHKNKVLRKMDIIDRLNGLEVRNMDGLELIKEFKDNDKAFLFLDPPYTQKHTTGKNKRAKIYKYEMLSDDLQKKFLNVLRDAKAYCLVCSYENELYDEILCNGYGWNKVPVADTVKSMSIGNSGTSKTRVTEYIYKNY